MKKCPRCNSPAPHRHPAMQFEGEIEVCPHDFHLTPTSENKPEYIAGVHEKREWLAKRLIRQVPEGDVG